ncbi:MAG: helix-turn-helix transcriptional regulator [Butyricicoccus sp.]|nr:helix-turn-helix transcriptional regulator [Butyricicoccus sp.]
MRIERYYPLQIPYLLNEEFQEHILYKEHRMQDINECCMCIWEMRSRDCSDKTIYNYILPDACIDIVMDFSNKTICFAAFSKETIPFELNQKTDYMGARLRPGAFYSLFGISAEKIMDRQIEFSEIENSCDLSGIFALSETGERLSIIKKYLSEKMKSISDTKFLELTETLYKNPSDKSVSEISNLIHCNDRQLYRLFKTNYGISPKVMLNILRLHLCLTLVLTQSAEFSDVVYMCGFYDQSHFIKEVKRYTGFSPLKLLEACR